MLYKLFLRFITVFISSVKLIVLALGIYYIVLPAALSMSIYLYDGVNFLYALSGNYISHIGLFGNFMEIITKFQFSQPVCSFLYKQGYFHLWNTFTNEVYSSRML